MFLSPYYGWVLERLVEALRGDVGGGETTELPRYETGRGPGSTAGVDFWTSREVREVTRSHVNYVVADTAKWSSRRPTCWTPIRRSRRSSRTPVSGSGSPTSTTGSRTITCRTSSSGSPASPPSGSCSRRRASIRSRIKSAAAERWVAAVNADAQHGRWAYAMVRRIEDLATAVAGVAGGAGRPGGSPSAGPPADRRRRA